MKKIIKIITHEFDTTGGAETREGQEVGMSADRMHSRAHTIAKQKKITHEFDTTGGAKTREGQEVDMGTDCMHEGAHIVAKKN